MYVYIYKYLYYTHMYNVYIYIHLRMYIYIYRNYNPPHIVFFQQIQRFHFSLSMLLHFMP